MALGFSRAVPPEDVSVVVNIGDDDRFHGLYVCPDLDTVLYTLGGIVDRQQGWGVSGDTTKALETLRTLDSPGAWMKLGDSDLGLHIYRTAQLSQGNSLTAVISRIAKAFDVACNVLPVSDSECPTLVRTLRDYSDFKSGSCATSLRPPSKGWKSTRVSGPRPK
ncbi:hypothetical protein AWV80_26155 [Cupriavidus sp. UYMU48A]|nr:hypothetical protein AWV80_26155 [Cupriavidus sp. UYMU48A]